MKIPELLSDIHRLLLECRHSDASDLFVDFIYSNQDRCKGVHFGQLGNLSQGSPEEIVSRLRSKLIECGLFKIEPVHVPKTTDPHGLDDDDLELIESVAAEYHSRAQSYVHDEESLHVLNSPPEPSSDQALQSTDDEEDEVDLDEEPEDATEEEFDVEAYDPTDYVDEQQLSSDDDDDDDFKGLVDLSADIEPLDDIDLQADSGQIVGNLVDDFVDDYFDFDEDDIQSDFDKIRDEFEEIDTDGALSHEERARQIAIMVGVNFGWGHSGVDLLTEIFTEHGWGQARVAIEHLHENGISEDELRLINDIKVLWRGNDSYSLAFLKAYNRTGYCTYQGGRVLSWVMAAKMVELFPNGDICEYEYFFDKAFDAWYERPAIRRRFPVFLNFLKHIVTWYDPERWLPGGMFFDDTTADDFEYEIEKELPYTYLYQNLEAYGLIRRNSKFDC